MLKKVIVDLAAYNLWANTQFADFFEKLDNSTFTSHVDSSFPSLQKTILHIWSVENVWLDRLKGHSPLQFVGDGFNGEQQTLLENWKGESKHFLDFVGSQTEEYFSQLIEITSHISGKFHDTAFNYALHACNHSTMHRGQLITMCRALKVSGIPRTDLIFYQRLLKS